LTNYTCIRLLIFAESCNQYQGYNKGLAGKTGFKRV
jgi:hypothetical protein